tara:strand:- start:297 stop:1034 length:738 start_codon:yes stop_codon:yes gene_type:complete
MDIDRNERVILKKYFRAYITIQQLMKTRGFNFVKGKNEFPLTDNYDDFVKQIRVSKNHHQEPWLTFIKDGEPETKVGLIFVKIDKIKNKDIVNRIVEYTTKAVKNRVHIIIIYDEINSGPASAFKTYPKNNQPRDVILQGTTLELLHYDKLLFNPLKFTLQPKITHVIDPIEKENLRLYLVRDIKDKDMQLKDLCPLIFVERQLCTWLGAKLDDVLLFDNGEIRYVVNEPHLLSVVMKKNFNDDE